MVYLIEDGTLSDIADAIREKTSSNAPIITTDMPDKIRSISGGGEAISHGSCIDDYTEINHYDEFEAGKPYETEVAEGVIFWAGLQGACIDKTSQVIHVDEFDDIKEILIITTVDNPDTACFDLSTLFIDDNEAPAVVIRDFAKLTVTVTEG